MTRFEKTHPVIRNERGCLIDRLFLSFILFVFTASVAVACTMLIP